MIYCEECQKYLDKDDIALDRVPKCVECGYPIIFETAAGEDAIIKKWQKELEKD